MNLPFVNNSTSFFVNGMTTSSASTAGEDSIKEIHHNLNSSLEKDILQREINTCLKRKRLISENISKIRSSIRAKTDLYIDHNPFRANTTQYSTLNNLHLVGTNPGFSTTTRNNELLNNAINAKNNQVAMQNQIIMSETLRQMRLMKLKMIHDSCYREGLQQKWTVKCVKPQDYFGHNECKNTPVQCASAGPSEQGTSSTEIQDKLCSDSKQIDVTILQDQEAMKSDFDSKNKRSGKNWYKRYQELAEFKKKIGHCNVKRSDNKILGKWVANQRFHYKLKRDGKQSNLSDARINALENLGIEWNVKLKDDRLWDDRYYELVAFKEENGHCNVPQRYKDNLSLAEWVVNQRYQFKKINYGNNSYLTPERIEALDKLGFEWSPGHKFRKLWPTRFDELVEFKKKHGHCNVPYTYEPNTALGLWVVYQRHQYRRRYENKTSYITPERIEALNEIGFEWNLSNKFNKQWEERYDELVEFKKRYGHCNVSRDHHNDVLGRWVSYQRSQYSKKLEGKPSYISEDRIEALNKVGFQWKVKCGRVVK